MPLTPGQRLMFLSPRVPHPLNNGAKIRTSALLHALCGQYAVDYVGFLQRDLGEAEARSALACCASVTQVAERSWDAMDKLKLLAQAALSPWPATILKYSHPEICEHVRDWFAKNPGGLAHADHIHMAQYLKLSPCRLCVIDEHNVEAQIIERSAEHFKAAGAMGGIATPLIRSALGVQARRMRGTEASMIAGAGLTLAVSEGDAEQLRAMSPGKRIEVIPNGVDTDYFSPPPPGAAAREPRRMIFTGSMNWLPNEDAVLYFCEKILPALNQGGGTNPWRLDIVGQNPSAGVKALASPAVRVTGTVDDVRPYTHAAEVFIVPLRIGGGSRLKILEAFGMGIPVVSTSVGCEGLGVTDGQELLIADTPEAFVTQLHRLHSEPRMGRDLAKRARQFVLDRFTWEAIGRRLLDVYRELS